MDYFIEAANGLKFPELTLRRSIGDFRLCRPQADSTAATVVICDSNFAAALEFVQPNVGWLIVAEASGAEKAETEAVKVDRLLRRLGVAASRTVIVAELQYWAFAVELGLKIEQAQLVGLVHSQEQAEGLATGVFSNSESSLFAWHRMRGIRSLSDRVTVLVSDTIELGQNVHVVNEMVSFPSKLLAPEFVAGFSRFAEIACGFATVLAGGGSMAQFVRRMVEDTGPQTPSGFLPHLDDDEAFARMARIQVEFGDTGLALFGFDLVPWRRSDSWGSRAHSVVIRDRCGVEVESVRLGALRREVLDALVNMTPGALTQAYGAFGFPGNSGYPWWDLADGSYHLQVVDERGVNIIPLSGLRLLNESGVHEMRIASICVSETGHLLLDVVSL